MPMAKGVGSGNSEGSRKGYKNLRVNSSEMAREMQKKSVEKRKANKQAKELFKEEFEKQLKGLKVTEQAKRTLVRKGLDVENVKNMSALKGIVAASIAKAMDGDTQMLGKILEIVGYEYEHPQEVKDDDDESYIVAGMY